VDLYMHTASRIQLSPPRKTHQCCVQGRWNWHAKIYVTTSVWHEKHELQLEAAKSGFERGHRHPLMPAYGAGATWKYGLI